MHEDCILVDMKRTERDKFQRMVEEHRQRVREGKERRLVVNPNAMNSVKAALYSGVFSSLRKSVGREKMMNVRIAEELRESVNGLAWDLGVSTSDLLRMLLESMVLLGPEGVEKLIAEATRAAKGQGRDEEGG